MFTPLTEAETQAIFLTLRVAFWATLLSLPPGIALAWLLERKRFPLRGLVDALVHLPLVLPPVVTGWLLLVAFGRRGPVGEWLYDWFGITLAFRWTGAVLAAAVMAFPLLVRAVRLSIAAIDRQTEIAAQGLGAAPWQVFWRITLPLSLPGIVAGGVLCFARAVGEFGATITFVANIPGQTQTLSSAIYAALQVPGGAGQATRLIWVSLVIALGAILVAEWLARRIARRQMPQAAPRR